MATKTTTIKFVGQFDSSGITRGLQDIKKQVTNANISEELKKQFETAFNKLQVNIPALEKLTSKEDFNLKDIQALQKLLKEVTKDWENLHKVTDQIDLSKTFSSADLTKIQNLDKQIKETKQNVENARKELIESFTKDNSISSKSKNISDALTELFTVNPNEINNKFNEIKQQFTKGYESTQNELQNKIENAKIFKDPQELLKHYFGEDSGVTYGKGMTKIKDEVNAIVRSYREFKKANDETNMAKELEKLQQVLSDSEKFKIPEGESWLGLPTKEDLDTLNLIEGALQKIKDASEGKQVFFTEQEAQLLELIKQKTDAEAEAARNCANAQVQLKETVDNTGNAFQDAGTKTDNLADQYNKVDAQSKALSATFGSLANRITNSISALTVFNKSIQIVHKAIASVKELDAAFTQIAIVSEQTNEQAWQMFDSFNKLAKQYSITTKDLTEGAKLFYQQGLNASDTMKMVEASTISAALGEVTMTEAANTLTAAIQGYNESAEVAMAYTDKIAMVGAVSAADFNELSAAMEKTASSAYTAGIDFDHLLGYLGKMIEVTREAPANLGTAMKTIIARFEDMKKDPNALIDGASANKVEAALATIGIALRDTAGEFRPLQDVFDELGAKWNTLSRNQQAYIATVAAGSRQQSRFLALMNNYDRTLDLITESENSAGAALKQYATYQDSAAAATARLTAAWEEFYTKIVNSEQIIWVIDRLKDLVEVMTKIGPIPSAIAASLAALGGQTVLKSILPNLSKNLAAAATTGKALSFSLSGIKAGVLAVGASFLEVAGIIAAIVLVIYGAVKAWQALDKALHPVREDAKRLTKEVNSLNEKISESSKKTSSLEKLMDRYDELYNKIYRTKEEQEELNQVISDIDKSSDRAVVSIDKNGDAHLQNADSVKKEIQAEKDYIKMNAELVYAKKKELLTNNEVTEDQARSVGLNKYGDLIAFEDDNTVKDYKKYRDAIYNRINDSSNSNKILNELYSGHENAAFKINQDIFGKDANFKTFTEALNAVQEKAMQDAIKDAEDKGIELNSEELGRVQQEAADTYAFLLLRKVYGNLDDLVEKYSDDNLNSDYKEQLKIEAANEALTDYYNQMAEADEKYKVLADLFEKTGMSADEFEEIIDNEDQFFKDYSDAIQKYLDSDKTTDDVQALVDVLDDSKQDIADALQDWINEAIKQSFTTADQKQQFINDNAKLFNSDDDELRRRREYLIRGGSITNDELAKMQDIAKSIDFQDSDKFNLFGLFAEDNTELNDLINNYVKKINNGLYSEADQIKQTMIQLLSSKGISGPAAQRLSEFFIEDYESYINNRLSQAEGNYKSAKDIYKKDPQEALTDKEYEFIASLDKNVDRYININEQGERYLSILGKINLLENTRVEYVNAVNEKMLKNADDMTRYGAEIVKANEELEKGLVTDEKQIDARKSLIKTNEQLIINLKQENDLYQEQLQAQEDINNAAAAMVLGENISRADLAAKNIEKIGQAFGEAQQNAGELSFATAQSLLAMDDSYQQYIKIVNGMVTLSADGAEAMTANETKKYNDWLELQKNQLKVEQTLLKAQLADIKEYLAMADGADKEAKKEQLKTRQQEINAELAKQKEGNDKTGTQNKDMLKGLQDQYNKFYEHLFEADKEWKKQLTSLTSDNSDEYLKRVQGILSEGLPTVTVPEQTIEIADLDFSLEDTAFDKALEEEAAQIEKRLNIIDVTLEELDSLSANFGESFKKGVSSAIKSGGKDAEDSLKKLEKILEDMTEALENLDKLIKEVNYDLNAIRPDYNPFTQLFEAWEKEWDYYYNIKRLIAELGQQGQFIDNIISADFVSADKKVSAYHAKIGNLIAQMSANDTYITSLRAGMSQTAVELMKEYGEYYKINPETGQIYQTDKSLNEINTTINAAKEELYQLSKVQNARQNDLNLENSKLEALEQEKSAYESILSEVESQIDSYKNLDDIVVNTSELEAARSTIKAKIEISDESIEAQKEKIRDMEDEIQNLEIEIELKGNVESELEKSFDKMGDIAQKYEGYWENLNSAILEAQELLSQLNEKLNDYVETAISIEQELYNAIVENYQNEINKKKQQYDYLKQLDKDYLASVKDTINKERQARQEANKQKGFQQNLQRMQLLQQDTSGAYRNELAELGKEVENQRQELYDDLVDKQVDELEKEINKRHELYDKEVAALEERLAYMQENAILLWEMVNNIVANGTDAMMAELENTTNYINSNELNRQRQRKKWEDDIALTYDGVVNDEINNIKAMIKQGNEYVENLEEIQSAIETNIETYQVSTEILVENNSEFQSAMNAFMSEWNRITYRFTGYYESWEQTVEVLKSALDNNIQALINMNNEGGSIKELNNTLRNTAREMYNDFIAERQRYRNEIEGLIQQIKTELLVDVNNIGDVIKRAAESAVPAQTKQNTSGTVGTQSAISATPTTTTTTTTQGKYKITINASGMDLSTGQTVPISATLMGYTSKEAAIAAANEYINRQLKNLGLTLKSRSTLTPVAYAKGGLANFTGPAWLDGTSSAPERILSPRQTKLFESMVHSLEKSANSNINSGLGSSYNIGDINTTIQVDRLDNETDINKLVKQVEDKILKTIRNRVVVSV